MARSRGAIGAPHLRHVLLKACRMDVVAFKPGNVSICAQGHDMRAEDFLISAKVAVPALCEAEAGVGDRIEAAISATNAAVGCNTNLGIVLLLAPLAAAAQAADCSELRPALAAVLKQLTVEDSVACYRAIRLAKPAGLGHRQREDVFEQPTLALNDIMQMAARDDTIARQYATVFELVFSRGKPLLQHYLARWHSLAWATTACYLNLLAEVPDSHVARKFGSKRAEQLSEQVRPVVSLLKACENPRLFAAQLIALDRELKRGGINPGTTADLTVASLAVELLQRRRETSY